MPGRAPGPSAVPRLLERDGIGRFMDLGSLIDRGNHEPVRPVYLAILAVKCALLAVRCSPHAWKWPARPTDRAAGGRLDLLVASDRDPAADAFRDVPADSPRLVFVSSQDRLAIAVRAIPRAPDIAMALLSPAAG